MENQRRVSCVPFRISLSLSDTCTTDPGAEKAHLDRKARKERVEALLGPSSQPHAISQRPSTPPPAMLATHEPAYFRARQPSPTLGPPAMPCASISNHAKRMVGPSAYAAQPSTTPSSIIQPGRAETPPPSHTRRISVSSLAAGTLQPPSTPQMAAKQI